MNRRRGYSRASDRSARVEAWTITPDIVVGILLVATPYAAALWTRGGRQSDASHWRHAAFFGGLAVLFLALQSPLDELAEHSFAMHQVQHLLLQTVGPMLVALAAPQRLLVAGLPVALRRGLLVPLLSSKAVREVFGFLMRPWIAALALVASLYVWHWPAYHDLALLNDGVHYAMHITMLAAGMLFFTCIFDPRPAPLGATYGTRINILWAAMTASVVLGAVLALKDRSLYPAYEEAGRLWGMTALEDERLGGLIMWIPGSAACVPAFLVLLRMWSAQETRVDDRRRRGISLSPTALRPANYRTALWLALAAFAGFAGTLAIGLAATGPRP